MGDQAFGMPLTSQGSTGHGVTPNGPANPVTVLMPRGSRSSDPLEDGRFIVGFVSTHGRTGLRYHRLLAV